MTHHHEHAADPRGSRAPLGAMTAGELRRRYQEVGGDEARSRNRACLFRRIPRMHDGCNPRYNTLQSADTMITIRGWPPIA